MRRKPTEKKLGKYISSILLYSDLIILNILFLITLLVCSNVVSYIPDKALRIMWVLVNVSYVPPAMWTFNRAHGHRVILIDHVLLRAFQMVISHALIFTALNVFIDNNPFPLRCYAMFYGMALVVLPLWSIFSRHLVKRRRRKGLNFERVVIIGTNPTAVRLLDEMNSDAGFGYRVFGFFDDEKPENFPHEYLGGIDKLDAFIQEYDIDCVFFTLPGTFKETLSKVIEVTDRNVTKFFYVPQIPRVIRRGFELRNIGSVPILSIRRNPLNNIINQWLKRGFDILMSTTFLVLSPIIFIPVAIAIKLSSPGPVFFKQDRTGYRGNSFKCYKFRTMRVNANADKMQATKDDPRKTRLGNFLRHTSIDELPQFINVFLGDMSVVGPRPHMLKHTEEYSRIVDKYMVRHAVKPGITGWAQVNGYRGLTDELWKMERRVEFDVWYIENWTFFLDLKIIVRTVINAVAGEKNAF